jgi:hypothetical protein
MLQPQASQPQTGEANSSSTPIPIDRNNMNVSLKLEAYACTGGTCLKIATGSQCRPAYPLGAYMRRQKYLTERRGTRPAEDEKPRRRAVVAAALLPAAGG